MGLDTRLCAKDAPLAIPKRVRRQSMRVVAFKIVEDYKQMPENRNPEIKVSFVLVVNVEKIWWLCR